MQLFYQQEIKGTELVLDPDESRHLSKVLRKPVGDIVLFTNGKGSLFSCRIEDNDPKKAKLVVVSQEFVPKPTYHIHLAISPTKNADRMEWMMEKITEIGVDEVTFIQSENSERTQINLDRLQKKSINACKQSCQAWVPEINDICRFGEFLADKTWSTYNRFICYVDETIPSHLIQLAKKDQSYLILVGPEGDFSPSEIKEAVRNGFAPCSLGKNRLRTETAGLAVVHTLQLLNIN
ncbi:MAG TPA: RsmE family RNA methyltransferase [Lunatimonas sp.]|nr:RsmE family RNA methyltransferase [Lunatimonas sp.]